MVAHELARPGGLVHGLALVALTSRLGGLLGSLVTGVLIAQLGSAAAYLLVAAGYLVSALAMLPARSSPPATSWPWIVFFIVLSRSG